MSSTTAPPLEIRGVRAEDAPAVHAIFTSTEVVWGTMRVPLSRIEHTEQRLMLRTGVHQVVAVRRAEVVGFAELLTWPEEPRARHAGEISLVATAPGHTGGGVGAALTSALIGLADDWLQLTRLGLVVFVDNHRAIDLYGRMGFAVEGTMVHYAARAGGWVDALQMGRISTSSPQLDGAAGR